MASSAPASASELTSKVFAFFQNDAEVYAISGSSLSRAKHFAEKYNIPVACADYKELCDMDELDLVCIASPNKLHKEMLEYDCKESSEALPMMSK